MSFEGRWLTKEQLATERQRRSDLGLIGRFREDYGWRLLGLAILLIICVPWWMGMASIWNFLF